MSSSSPTSPRVLCRNFQIDAGRGWLLPNHLYVITSFTTTTLTAENALVHCDPFILSCRGYYGSETAAMLV